MSAKIKRLTAVLPSRGLSPTPEEHLRENHLTSLHVSNLKYLTDGPSRVINLSEGKKIFLYHTSEVKIFDFCNETIQMISAAIRALSEECIILKRRESSINI